MDILSSISGDFVLRAFVAGTVTAIIAPLIGIFLVTRRYSFMADALAHISLAGVAISYALGGQPIVVAMIGSIVASLALEELRIRTKVLGESALVIFLSFGLALAAVISSADEHDLEDVLFGSILNVTSHDLVLIVVLGLIVIGTITLFFKELTAITFDEELAETGGIPVRKINRIFAVLSAVTISLSMRVVGTLLIGALIVIPVVAAMQWSKSFRSTLGLSIVFSLFSVMSGLLISHQFDISSGGTIVLISIAIFTVGVLKKIFLKS